MIFIWCKFGFRKCCGASPWSNHCAGCCWLSFKIHFSSHITIWSRNGSLLLHKIREDNTSKQLFFFFFCCQLTRYRLTKLFHLSSLLQVENDHRMADTEFFSNFSWGCKRNSFKDPLNWSLSTSDGQPLCFLSSRLSSLQNFLNHHCTVHSLGVPGPNMLLMLSCLCCFMTHFELK